LRIIDMADPLSVISVLIPSIKGPFMEEETMRALIDLCPAVRRKFETGEIQDDFSKGFLSSMAQIYVALDENGMGGHLRSLSEDEVAEVDSILSENSTPVSYLLKELPEINKLVGEEDPNEFNAGAVLAFVSVARHVTNLEEEEAEPQREPEIDINEAPKASTIAPPGKEEWGPPILTDLTAMVAAGIPLDQIDIRPVEKNGRISLDLRVMMTGAVALHDVIRVGRILQECLNKPAILKSDMPIYFTPGEATR
jgi:hypothetical protein